MKKITLLLFSLILTLSAYAQQQALKITNLESGKEVIIKETKKVRVKNKFGQEFSGRFIFEGEDAISIDGRSIDLINIEEIRRSPVLQSAFIRGLLIYGGALLTGTGALVGIFGNPAGFALMIPGAAMIYAGVKAKGFNKRYKAEDNWTYELVTIQQ